MRMRAKTMSDRESARLSVSLSCRLEQKWQNRTLDAHEVFTETNARFKS
jgi:hypothetical protein